MELIQEISRKFVVFRPSKFADSILQQILNSKRLLADHIELLEHCQATRIDYTEYSPRTKYTFHLTNGFALTLLAVTAIKTDLKCLRILVPTAATTYGLYISAIAIGTLKNKLTQYRLNGILSSIDMVDAAIRRNISFLRESKFLTDAALSKGRCNQTDICLKSTAEIIRILYDEVKRLEAILLPNHIESMYEPIEELKTCIYFQRSIEEFSCDDIKAFYNIFLYFQSQYLTRFCLIICYDQQRGLKYLNEGSIELRKNLRTNVKQLNENVCQKQRSPDVNWQEKQRAKNDDTIVSTDIFKIKRSSMDVLCRLIAIVNQYQNTDDRIQVLDKCTNKQQLMDILNEMKRVNESLCTCQTDFETLKLIYTKCLMKSNDLPNEMEQNANKTEPTPSIDEQNTSISLSDKNHLEEESGEYFAMRDIKNTGDTDSDEDDNQNRRSNKWYDELDNIDMKVTRSFFAPVLKQLKTKIDPIKDEMKEREMKFLLSKGIDRERILEFDKNNDDDTTAQERNAEHSDCESDEDGSASDEILIKSKTKSKYQASRYDEMRTFLEQKQQIQFLPLGNLPPLSGAEDVLE